jgi:serine/threonine protein kinase
MCTRKSWFIEISNLPIVCLNFRLSLTIVIFVPIVPGRGYGQAGMWKLADFGISSVGTSKKLLVTVDGRGTPQYCTPEILLAQVNVPSYTSKVDIWGLGLILYELFKHEPLFESRFDVEKYYLDSNQSLPLLPALDEDKTSASLQTQCLLSPLDFGIKHIFEGDGESLFCGPLNKELDKMLAMMLERNPELRPSSRKLSEQFQIDSFREFFIQETLLEQEGRSSDIWRLGREFLGYSKESMQAYHSRRLRFAIEIEVMEYFVHDI